MKKLSLVFGMVLMSVSFLLAQRTITGKITDADTGEGLISASVLVEGTARGTVTDATGNYSIDMPQGSTVLVFSYTGYSTQKVTVGAENVINIQLAEGVTMNNVVITALGLEEDRDKSAKSSTQVGGDLIKNSGETGVLQGIAGKSSGVIVTRSSGDPGAGAYIQIRGQNTITGNTQPLIVIDGMPMSNSSIGPNNESNSTDGVVQQSRLNDINPDDIENVEILKGAAAAAIWGTRAANGVIVVTTKKGTRGAKKFDVNFRSSVSFDQVNIEHELQDIYGQGSNGNYVANTGFSWGDEISKRTLTADQMVTAPGQYFDASGNDLYAGYFDSEGGTQYHAILPSNTDIYDAAGNLLETTGAGGGKANQSFSEENRDQVFRQGFFVDNSISIGGGDLMGGYYLSVSDLRQEGVINGNSDYNRTTFRLNSTRRFNDFLKFDVNAFYSKVNSSRIQTGSNLNGLYLGYLRTSPDFNNTDYKGTYYSAGGSPTFNSHRGYRRYLGNSAPTYNNPGWTVNEQINTSAVNRFMFQPEMTVNATDWLTFTARVGVDAYNDNRLTHFPVFSGANTSTGLTTDELFAETQMNTDIFARISKQLNENITTNIIVGFNLNDRSYKNIGGTISNFTIPGAPATTLDNAPAGNTTPFNTYSNIRTNAGYVDANFDMYDMLNVQLTARSEVASSFTDNIIYPSAALAWRFTQLEELKGNDILSFGKLRLAYGTVGIQPAVYLSTTDYVSANVQSGWGQTLDASLYGGSFVRSATQGNPDLRPETKTELEFGTDLRLFKDKIGLNVTYYTNTVDGAIFAVDVPASTGFTNKWDNAATIENKGLEIDLNAAVVNTGDFKATLFGNYSHNRNEVVDLQGVQSIFLNGFTGSSARAVEGEPMSTLWGGKWARNADNTLELDANGFPQQALEEGIIGDANPDWRGSAGAQFSYKGFGFSVLFETMQGNDMWGGTYGVLNYFGKSINTANEVTATQELKTVNGGTIAAGETFRGEIGNFGAGDVALDQSWYTGLGGGFGPIGEQFVFDASWTRLREIALTYRINSAKFKAASKLDFIELGVSGRNLYLWSEFKGIDPDSNLTGASNGRGLDYFSNPGTRSVLFTIKVNY